MGINNEGIVNRRQLLVRAGSFMKMSWRKSREELIDNKDDEGSDNSCLRKSKKSKKRNLSVRFSDDFSSSSSIDEPLSCEEIENRWYQSSDYSRFKKDTILTSMNYVNAKRASKFFDETENCIWGIEEMCYLNPMVPRRNLAEKRKVFRVVRKEQARQKKEMEQRQQNGENDTALPRLYPDLEKFRSVSVMHSKGGRDRALARGSEYFRATRQTSLKNLFSSMRKQTAVAA